MRMKEWGGFENERVEIGTIELGKDWVLYCI